MSLLELPSTRSAGPGPTESPVSAAPAPDRDATRPIVLHQPRVLAFGAGCAARCAEDLLRAGRRRPFVITSSATATHARPFGEAATRGGCDVALWSKINNEPTVADFRAALAAARDHRADAIVGVGGGSPLDVAKLVAALTGITQDVRDAFGIGKLGGRGAYLACLPTTAGTGSEVSPNAILLDETDRLKKGVISPYLVPDAAYVDPLLTLSVPPAVTAATGMDALVHCIEAYANRFAHALTDVYAIEGVRLIAANLCRAVERGDDVEARTAVALGSLYGGLCLGPVNTGAVHALAYPLGGEFGVAHGVSNAVLLPHVLEFNLPADPRRYADIAIALGAAPGRDDTETARRGLAAVRELSRQCGIPTSLSQLGVPRDAIDRMARSAMTVTRLLERNVREMALSDAIEIYHKAF